MSDNPFEVAEDEDYEPPHDECPKCHKQTLVTGYGLAGGGIGPYVYCDDYDGCGYFEKFQDPDYPEDEVKGVCMTCVVLGGDEPPK